MRLVRLAVILFPMVVGSALSALGWQKLRDASVVSIPKWSPPYGFLVFTTFAAEGKECSVAIHEIDVDANTAQGKIKAKFTMSDPSSSEEAVIGFQIPYGVEVLGVADILGTDREGNSLEVKLLNTEVLAIGNNTSLVYLRFVPLQETSDYDVRFGIIQRGFIVREGFSSYAVTFPFTLSQVHKTVLSLFPNMRSYSGQFNAVGLQVSLPEGVEIRRTSPLPASEMVWPDREGRWFTWQVNMRAREAEQQSVSISFDVRERMELRNRLFFDSGLYMGIGIGLIISGFHEALKYLMKTE